MTAIVTGARAAVLRHLAELTLAAACAGAVWLVFIRTVVPVDLDVFLRAGRTVREGLTPYVDTSSPQVWSGHAFVYPYLTAWWFAPLSHLQQDSATLLYFLGSVLAVVLTVRLVGDPRRRLLLVAVSLTAEPVVRAMQLGTVNVWLLLGLAIAWRWRERALVVGAALTVLVVAKLFLLPMLCWLLATGRARVAVGAAAASAVAIIAGCLVVGLPLTAFAHMLAELSAHEAAQSSSVTAVLLWLGTPDRAAQLGAALLAVAILLAAWVRYRRTADERLVFGAAVVASLVLSPIVWSHYFVLLLIVPLIWRWNARALLAGLAMSWLVNTPVGSPALQQLRDFPGSGWALGVSGAVLAGLSCWWAAHGRPTRLTRS